MRNAVGYVFILTSRDALQADDGVEPGSQGISPSLIDQDE